MIYVSDVRPCYWRQDKTQHADEDGLSQVSCESGSDLICDGVTGERGYIWLGNTRLHLLLGTNDQLYFRHVASTVPDMICTWGTILFFCVVEVEPRNVTKMLPDIRLRYGMVTLPAVSLAISLEVVKREACLSFSPRFARVRVW